jgi:C-terminal processing protease CtpA/Prc
MLPEAMAYLTVALDYLQAHSVRRDHINWPVLRQEAEALATQAQTPADTYPAIRRALELLDDEHSLFLTPEQVQRLNRGQEKRMGFQMIFPGAWIGDVLPGSPAEQAGLHIGDHLETVNGLAVASLTEAQFYAACRQIPLTLTVTPAQDGGIRSVQVEPAVFEAKRRPWGRRLGADVGYLAVPAVMSLEAGRPYAAWAHHLIQEIDQTPTAGWVIDLRTNLGGSLWPMLAGVGPIVGEGEIMGFVAPGEKLIAFYRAGRAWIEGQERFSAQVDEPYSLKRPSPPVAVLTSQLTTSAGELTALAFRGRPHTRSFGEPTAGVPTANDDKALSDEATIYLTAYLGADRTGQIYSSPLLPDEPVSLDWPRFGADDDPVLETAIHWLHSQAGAL